MAYLADNVWSHPKYAGLSDKAFRAWANSLAYSSGYGLRGRLDPQHQRLVGATKNVRKELIDKRAWDDLADGGSVMIHDWADHNEKRDMRREKDRERKREARKSARLSAGQSTGRSTLAARVEGSEGSELKDLVLRTQETTPREHRPYDPPTNPTHTIRRQIELGVITDHITLTAELNANHINSQAAAELQALLQEHPT